MSMGAHPSTRIAQRFANEFMAELLRRFDEVDAPFLAAESQELQDVMAARSTLQHDQFGTQARLADAGQYTDDPIMGAVGVQRFIRLLRCFYDLVGPLGCRLMLAKAHKLHLGAAVKWLGATIASTVGCIWVPEPKLLHAVGQVRQAIDGTLVASEYRQLFGFLTSILFMLGDDDRLMHELEEPLRAEGALSLGPATRVKPSAEMARALGAWVKALLNFSGSSIMAALGQQEQEHGDVVWRPKSDAAIEALPDVGNVKDGLGGVLYHLWWRIELTDELRLLPIAVLEFIAKGVNMFTFDSHIPEAARIASEVDAQATVDAVANKAHSSMMRVVLEELTSEEAYNRRVREGLYTLEHLYGAGNIGADAASRGYEEVLEELGAALGFQAERVQPPPEAHAFIRRVLDRILHASWRKSANQRRKRPRPRTSDPAVAGGPAIRYVLAEAHLSSRLDRSRRQAVKAFVPSFLNDRQMLAQLSTAPPARSPKRTRTLGAGSAAGRGEVSVFSATQAPTTPDEQPSRTWAEVSPVSALPSGQREALSLGGCAIRLGASPVEPSPPPVRMQRDSPIRPDLTPAVSRLGSADGGKGALPLPEVPADRTPIRRRGPVAFDSTHSVLHATPPGGSERTAQPRRTPQSPGLHIPRVDSPIGRARQQGTTVRSNTLHTLLLLSGATASAVQAQAIELHPALREHQSARAQAMFAVLRSDSSSQAIRAEDERMLEMCELAVDALDSDDGELKGNAKSDWKHWIGFCSWAGVLPWRTNAAAALGTDADARLREQIIWINALLYIWPRMRNAPGRTTPPKPTSALAILKGIRRMHVKLGYETVPLTPVVRAMRKLLEKYRDTHGPEALQPHRKEPLTNELILALIAATRGDGGLSEGDRLTWVALWHFLAQTGMRKAEVALEPGAAFGLKHFSWDNVKWRVGGKLVPALTPVLRAQLTDGDMLIVRPPPSKADPFGLRWGVKPIYLPYSATAPICAARAVADLEIWRTPKARQMEQTFHLDAGILRKANVDEHFRTWVRLPYVAAETANRYSVHSFRSYLATALAEQGASTSRIQAMLRWASDDAVLIYQRTTEDEYAQWVRAAACADIDTILTHHLPRAEAARDGTRARDVMYEADGMVGEMLEAREMNALLAEAEHADAA